MTLKVLHVLGTASEQNRSIVEIVRSLAEHLRSDGFHFSACFLAADGPLRNELEEAGVEAAVVPWSDGIKDPLGALGFGRRLRRLNPHLIHQHYGGRSVRWVAKWITGSPVVVHVHGRGSESDFADRGAMRISFADAVIAPSRAVAMLIDRADTRVIYTGVPSTESTGVSAQTHVVGVVARLVPIKGIRYLIEAVASLCDEIPQLRLEIAGEGPLRKQLEELARDLNVHERVTFLGYRRDLRELFQRWSVLVLPTLDEALPISILQAMAAGVPVIASDVGGVPELIQHERSGMLVPPANSPALAGQLRRVLTNEELRQKIALNAQRRVRTDFTIQQMAQAVAAVYRSVLERTAIDG